MKWFCALALLGIVNSHAAFAQPVRVYSEFVKLDDTGNVLSPENPREILSPAVARNAMSSFQVAIQVPNGTKFAMYIGQNPENFAGVAMYRRKSGSLEPVQLPYQGDGPEVFWLDLQIAKGAPVTRVKIEPQVLIGDDWVIYPMEVRVNAQEVPAGDYSTDDAQTPIAMMRSYLCKNNAPKASPPIHSTTLTAAGFSYRNALQDIALAGRIPEPGRSELKKRVGGCDGAIPANPESYLRVRDFLVNP